MILLSYNSILLQRMSRFFEISNAKNISFEVYSTLVECVKLAVK